MDEEFVQRIEAQQQAIFERMTPEMVASTLNSIASAILDEHDKPNDVDVIHLRQIADWLEGQQNDEQK